MDVAGTVRLDPAAVRAAAALEGRSAFGASAREAAERIRALPPIADARVRILLPDLALIEVVERAPLLAVSFAGGRLYADGAGVLFALPGEVGGVPAVHDQRRSYAAGDRLDAGVASALRRLAVLDPAFYGSRLLRLQLTVAHGIVGHLDSGTELRFGSPERLDLKLEASRRIVQSREGRRLDYVDVRTPETPVFAPND